MLVLVTGILSLFTVRAEAKRDSCVDASEIAERAEIIDKRARGNFDI